MNFPEIVEKVQVKSKQALDSHLVGNTTAAVEALQEVATIISSEFGATDEVAAASPEGDEPSEEDEQAELLGLIAQASKHFTEARGAVDAGHTDVARGLLVTAADLIYKTLVIESS